jgi:protein-tyrosine phosphatase
LPFVDLHSHILPGLDDGAGDATASLNMVRGLAELGFETICATPHQKDGQFMPSAEAIEAAHQATVAAARQAGLNVRIPLAAENMWDSVFFERLGQNRVPGYGQGSAFLVEFRVHELPLGLVDQVFRLRVEGKLPVIAHPERYQPLWQTPALARQLAVQCAMVVDLGAVAGYHGRRQAKVARSMLKEGTAHAVASDAHSPADVGVAAEGMAWIRKKLGESALRRLLDEAPRQILAGVHPGG